MTEPVNESREFEIKKLLEKEMIYADKLWIKDRLKELI